MSTDNQAVGEGEIDSRGEKQCAPRPETTNSGDHDRLIALHHETWARMHALGG